MNDNKLGAREWAILSTFYFALTIASLALIYKCALRIELMLSNIRILDNIHK